MGTLIPPSDDQGLGEGYHSPQVAVDVRLNTNESPFPPPAAFVEALAERVRQLEFHRYPDRSAWAMRQGLAALHGVRPEQVFAANGSNEVLQTLLLTYGGPGRTALVFEPTYALHAHIAHITGTPVIAAERDEDFRLDPARAVAAVRDAQPAITFLCSPNNPS